MGKNSLVSIDLSTAKCPLGFAPGSIRFNCNVGTHQKLPLASNFLPSLLELQFRIEENIHNETFYDVPSKVFHITLKGMGKISLSNGEEWEILLGRIFNWMEGI